LAIFAFVAAMALALGLVEYQREIQTETVVLKLH